MTKCPDAAVIEIIERRKSDDTDTEGVKGILVPNEVRINGAPVLCPAENPVVVHEIPLNSQGMVLVTLTVFARRVTIGVETD